MNDEQKIEVGQVWKRKRDGLVIRITMCHSWKYSGDNADDWSWREVGKDSHKGRSYGSYIRRDYELQDGGGHD